MRFVVLMILLMLPCVAEAYVHLRVTARPRYVRWYPYAERVTEQRWRIVPRAEYPTQPDTNRARTNRHGQRWRTEPIPVDEASTIDTAQTEELDGYHRPDPNFGPEVMRNPNYTVRRVYRNIEVTSYNSERRQTDSTPWEIRANHLVRFGDAACNFLPKGTLFRLPNAPAPFNRVVFRVEDETAAKYGHRIDLWLLHVRQAENWGVKRLTVEVLGPPRGEAPR